MLQSRTHTYTYISHIHDIARASRSDTTPAAVVSPFDSIKNADNNTNILVSVFKEFMQTMKADGSERFPVLNVPEFDPSKRTQTIETWVSKRMRSDLQLDRKADCPLCSS